MSSAEMKEQQNESLEHTTTRDADASSGEEKHDLHQAQTLSKIDVENKAAFKGDDSDGAVDWTFRNILASIFLCMLYTGRHLPSR
jgi:hypothetical protein